MGNQKQPTATLPEEDGIDDVIGYDRLISTADARDYDVNRIRADFPILSELINGHALVWFDNGATTQKPQTVIDRLVTYYTRENSNVHRAVHAHTLANRAVTAYEGARAKVARFLGAPSHDDVIFVRGATEGINLVAQGWGRRNIGRGDEIIISHLEHHANIVPWQQLAEEKGARLRVIPVDDSGNLILAELDALLSEKTKIVAVTHASNAIGTLLPIKEIIDTPTQVQSGANLAIFPQYFRAIYPER